MVVCDMRALYCCVFVMFLWTCVDADCNVVTKKEWNGRQGLRVKYLARPLNLVIILDTATPWCDTIEKCQKNIRNLQDYMMDTSSTDDIGYSFLVGGDGNIYEGVGWLRAGSHTFKYNDKSISIAFIGRYDDDLPTTQQIEAVEALLKCGVEHGHLTQDFRVMGHNQLTNNDYVQSPGRNLYNVIKKWPQWADRLH